MFDFLEKFENRMEWIGVANSIINRKGKNTDLENYFNENELTNIIVSVLLFIMEKTLEENNECEMHHIETFLNDLIKTYYSEDINRQIIKEIAGYIIKDILQNNGVKHTYTTKNYSRNAFEEINIRLITDKIVEENNVRKIVYMLTNQGYDFLFRMREVDEEIQLTIEQLKLKEYIKRKKFSNAVRQSVELIAYVRQKKKDIEIFILSIRQNIHNVEIERYEALIQSTYAMLTEEYETMTDIQKMIYQAEEKIREEFELNIEFEEKLAKAKLEIQEIDHNIGVVITEQRDLILNRHSLTDLYMDTIKKTFEFSFEKRYDFEETILSYLEKYSNVLESYLSLLRPLFFPKKNKSLSVFNIYEPQIIFKEVETQDTHLVSVDEYDDSDETERILKISNLYVEVIKLIIRETLSAREITLSQIMKDVKKRDIDLYERVKENRYIFKTALKLYDMGVVPINDFFQGHKKIILMPSEEFNMEYCLIKIKDEIPGLEQVKELIIEKMVNEIRTSTSYEVDGMKIVENMEMSDLLFKVVI
ncbi:MAG: hypothetical protein WBL93_03565 [Lutisporaceae bacterium]